jgi:hypothetical protein
MIETRTLRIQNKRINTTDVKRVSEVILQEYLKLSQNHTRRVENNELAKYHRMPEASFSITTKDGVNYTAPLEKLADSDILDSKVVTDIHFKLYYYIEDIDLRVHISDSLSSGYHSFVEVQGSDSLWCRGIFDRLKEIISSFEAQSALFRSFRWPISVIFGLFVGYTLSWIVTLLIQQPNELRSVVISFVSVGGFMTTVFLFEDYLSKLWPAVELVPALEHERILEKRRRRLTWVITVIVVPFLIAIVVSLIQTSPK